LQFVVSVPVVGKEFEMNALSQEFELTVEGRQIEEAVASVFHTLLLHRAIGKFHYKEEGSYQIGTLGTEDVDCDYIDLTYVRLSSDELTNCLRREVISFRDALRQQDGQRNGQIQLEFLRNVDAIGLAMTRYRGKFGY
jgi:autophagy-related protein 101